MISFAQWLQSTSFFTELRGSFYVYPIILTLHVIGICVFGGIILMTDMRLLGWSMKKRPVSDLIQMRPLKHAGFMIMIICGALMAGCKAEEYYYNTFFHAKIGLLLLVLVHGLMFRSSVYRNAEVLANPAQMPGRAKLAAAISLILWTGLVIAGRGIGYIEPPLEKIHAQQQGTPGVVVTAVSWPRRTN